MSNPRRRRARVSVAEQEKRTIALRKLEVIKQEAKGFSNKMLADMYVYACEQQVLHDNHTFMDFMSGLDQTPVSIVEFLDSEDFVGGTDVTLWPAVRRSLIEMHRDWYKGKQGGAYTETILAGSTGNGKTETAKISFLYYTHILGCLKNPQKVYGLSKSTGITLAIFAAKPSVMKKAVYMPMRGLLEQMTWFRQYMPWDGALKSEIYFFKQNIRIVPAGLDADAVIGEAVLAAIIDEANFFPVVKQSKKVLALESNSTGGRTSEYDQVQVLYDTVNRRRDSRFTFMGQQVGSIIVSSSKKYVGDFTDRRIEHTRNYEKSDVYIYDRTQPEVVPQDRFSGEKFKISLSADLNGGLVIHEDVDDTIPISSKEYILPIEYLDKFRSDPNGALRDVLGIASTAISPFFANRLKILQTIERAGKEGYESFLCKDNVHMGTYGLPIVKEGHLCSSMHVPRSVHIDLSSTGDYCAIAMARFNGMVSKERPGGIIEILPTFVVEMVTSIEPDHTTPIDIASIRSWVRSLKANYRYPIHTVTYDTHASAESIQEWRKLGVKSGSLSMVRDSKPFKDFREMLYDERIVFCDNTLLVDQMFTLEHDIIKDRITHPYGGNDDLVHALIGSVTNLLRNPAMHVGLTDTTDHSDSLRPGVGVRNSTSDLHRR